MNRREQLIENYEDALMALFMDHVAEYEGEKLTECSEIIEPEEFSISPELDRRCLAEINNAEYKRKLRSFKKHAYSVVNKVAIVVLASLVLFTSAYAAFPEVRASTLNLLIEISDISTELKFGNVSDVNNIVAGVDVPNDSAQKHGITLAGYVLPESITSNYQLVDEGSDQFASWLKFGDSNNAFITVEVQVGEGTSIDVNTENDVVSEEVSSGHFYGLISQQENGAIIAGVADTEETYFILMVFEGIDFESAVAILTDYINVN